ncbi:5-oxoprolinase subunit PxpB [Pseudotenacibaculum sp. MALMAid0570]|uniref:5-oxoprolinase subunit PxpB n=1 Tax=Pseudotenacibaculum sp. MALMAid0570 TaxID=3143938 RepID=UPI0032DFE065
MDFYNLTYKSFGESAILIEWPAQIDEGIIQDIVAFESSIKNNNVLDTIIAYNSLTISYKEEVDFTSEVSKLKSLYKKRQNNREQESKLWEIPVCYDLKFGLDLEELATEKKLSVDTIIRLHSEPRYLIYFLGFQPGFLYLGGLNERIHMPRRENPRLRVAKGSVGIGGEQTGVYPYESAGGWNLIGRSPIDFFDVSKLQPCFAKAGDRIQFVQIDLDAFYKIEDLISKGKYQIKSI